MKRLALLLLVVFFPISSIATDMTIRLILSPRGELVAKKPIPIKFWVHNINMLDADTSGINIRIMSPAQQEVYNEMLYAYQIPKYDSVFFEAPLEYVPQDTGTYSIRVNVDFAEDIDRSNDTVRSTFHVVAPAPDLGTRIRRFSSFGPTGDTLTTIGMIEFTIPPTTKPCFLNVLIRRNDTSEAVWIVRNLLYIGPEFTPANPIGTFIDFRRIGLLPDEEIDSAILCISCTETALAEAPEPDATCEWFPITPDIYNVGPGNIEATSLLHPDPFFVDSLPTFLPLATLRDTVERGCTMPNIDLDSSAHPGAAAGYKGDNNACGPAAAANSLEWMEQARPDLMNTGLTHRQKMEELSAFSNRQPNGPTGLDDFIKSKLAFIDKYKLPITVKFQKVWGDTGNIASPDPRYGHSADDQGGTGAALTAGRTPQWRWVVQEMKDSEDVELLIGWWDSTGTRRGGHFFTLTGVAEINGQKQFRFKEDDTQRSLGGTHMPSVFWDSSNAGWPRILDLSWSNRTCFIEAAISESFDTSVAFVEGGVNDLLRDKRLFISAGENPTSISREVAIDLFVAIPGSYTLSVGDLGGNEIVLAQEFFDFGSKRLYWDGTINGKRMPAGVYFVRLRGNGLQTSTKIVRY